MANYSRQQDFDVASKRWWRTRIDPFQSEWPDIQEMLEANENLSAKAILELLIFESPEKFNWTHLRTLQRRIKSWRLIHERKFGPSFLPS